MPIRIITCTTSACIRARRKAARGPERHDSASLRVTTAPHCFSQGFEFVCQTSSRSRSRASKFLSFFNCRVRTESWNHPRTFFLSFSHTAITSHASLISQRCCACGSQYTPAKPPAGLAADALDTTSASTVAARAPRRSRAHQPKVMPVKRPTAIVQLNTAAHARRHGHTQPAKNIGMLLAGIMAATHNFGSKLMVENDENDDDDDS